MHWKASGRGRPAERRAGGEATGSLLRSGDALTLWVLAFLVGFLRLLQHDESNMARLAQAVVALAAAFDYSPLTASVR